MMTRSEEPDGRKQSGKQSGREAKPERLGHAVGGPRPSAQLAQTAAASGAAESASANEPFGSRIGLPFEGHAIAPTESADAFGGPMVARLERASGADLSGLRMHTDSAAAAAAESVGARAFARGSDIYFGAGEYDPGTKEGQHLIAHEVAHTIQQQGGSGHVAAKSVEQGQVSGLGAAGLHDEAEADAFADAFVAGAPTPSLTPSPTAVARKRARKRKDRAKDGGKESAANLEVPVRIEGTRAIVSTDWLFKDKDARRTAASGKILAPTKTPRILRAFRSTYTWFKDEQIEQSARQIYWLVAKDARKQKVVELPLQPSAFALFGLPPETRVRWLRKGSDALALFSHELLPTGAKGGKPFAVDRALLERAVTALETWTGAELNATNRDKFASSEWRTKTHASHRAFGITVSQAWIESLIGAEAWEAFLKGAGDDVPGTGVTVTGGTRFTDEVSEADRAYFQTWMDSLGLIPAPPRSGWQIPVGASFIRLLKKIDEDPALKERVLAALKRDGLPLRALSATDLRSLVNRAEIDGKREEFGLGNRVPRDGARKPKYNRPVRGAIINRGGLVYRNKKIELAFELTSQMNELAVPSMTVQWIAHLKGDKDKYRQQKTLRYLVHRDHERWSVRFNKAGTYLIHAVVNHDMFEEAYFSTEIEVKSKDERQRELDTQAFGHMGKAKTKARSFDTSWLDEKIGDHEYHEGLSYESVLPRDFKASGYADMQAFLAAEAERMDAAIAAYQGVDPLMVRMAKRYKSRLVEMGKDVGRDRKDGFVPFEVNGAFLSDQNGVPDKTLKLLGVARQAKAKVVGERIGPQVVHVKIHDTSFVTERVKYEFSAEAPTFMGALENAFLDLCKSYPKGRVSFMAQELDGALLPTGSARGFQLETGTAWKDLKSDAWSPTVQAVINIAGAAAMVFAPGIGMAVVFPLLIGYNATDTLDNVAQLKAKGILTREKAFNAAAMIGLDFIPYLGRLKVVQQFGKLGLYGLEGIELGAQALMITREALDNLEELKKTKIAVVGELVEKQNALLQELAKRTRENPSDPQIKALEAKLTALKAETDRAVVEARGASKVTFNSLAANYTALVVGVGASKAIGDAMPSHREAAFEGRFRHKKGQDPHYDAETGRVVGDREKLHDANVEDLKNAQLADLQHKQAEIANLLGADPADVIIRSGGRGRARVKKIGDDYVVTIPKKRSLKRALDDVWIARKGKKGAPKKRPKAVPKSSDPTFDPQDIVGKTNIAVGRPLPTAEEGHIVLERLAAGDASALMKLGVKPPKGFDTRRIEWGLGALPDGGFIIIRGEPSAVDWSPFPGVKALAHSHPIAKGNKLQEAYDGTRAASWEKMTNPTPVPYDGRAAVFPSPGDFAFCSAQRLKSHAVVTPFVKQGNRVLRSDDISRDAHPLVFTIHAARPVGVLSDGTPVYRAKLSAKVGGKEIWAENVWASYSGSKGNGSLHLEAPADLRKASAKTTGPRSRASTDSSGRGALDRDSKPALATTAKPGIATSRESIRTGEVAMEDHPQFETIMGEVTSSGFEIRKTPGPPRVIVEEFYSQRGELVETEKALYVVPGMRFLDLEHELGHIRQLLRFGESMPPTDRLRRTPHNPRAEHKNRDGVISEAKNATMEYHNRLDEFLRLKARGVSPTLLREHARGVAEFRELRRRRLRGSGGSPARAWEKEHFSDLEGLEDRYRQQGGLELER